MNEKINRANLRFSNSYIAALIIPLIAETALAMAVGIADTIMVAQAGEEAVSGVSCINTIQNLYIGLIMAFCSGGAVVVCQLLGMEEREKACQASKLLLHMAFLCLSFVSLLFLVFRNAFIDFIYKGLEPAVFQAAALYTIPIMLSMPFHALFSGATAICRSMGKSKITMQVSLVVNLINIAGNAIYIFLLHQGAFGVGMATLLSRIAGTVIMLLYLSDRKKLLYVSRIWKAEFDFRLCRLILSQAIPSAIERSLFQVGKVLIAGSIVLLGTSSIAAYAILCNAESFVDVPGNAINLAAITIIGQCAGAGDEKQVRFYSAYLMRLGYALVFLTALICFFLRRPMVSLYHLGPEASAMAIAIMAYDCCCRVLAWPSSFTVPSILRATGDVTLVMVSSLLTMWLCRVLLSRYLGLTLGLGLLGIQMGMWSDWFVRSFIFVPRLLSGKWAEKGISLEKRK